MQNKILIYLAACAFLFSTSIPTLGENIDEEFEEVCQQVREKHKLEDHDHSIKGVYPFSDPLKYLECAGDQISQILRNPLWCNEELKKPYKQLFSSLVKPILSCREHAITRSPWSLVSEATLKVTYRQNSIGQWYASSFYINDDITRWYQRGMTKWDWVCHTSSEGDQKVELVHQLHEIFNNVQKIYLKQKHGFISLGEESLNDLYEYINVHNITLVFDVMAGSGILASQLKSKNIPVYACDIDPPKTAKYIVCSSDAKQFITDRNNLINSSAVLLVAAPPHEIELDHHDGLLHQQSNSTTPYLRELFEQWIQFSGRHILVLSDFDDALDVLQDLANKGKGQLYKNPEQLTKLRDWNLPYSYNLLHFKAGLLRLDIKLRHLMNLLGEFTLSSH